MIRHFCDIILSCRWVDRDTFYWPMAAITGAEVYLYLPLLTSGEIKQFSWCGEVSALQEAPLTNHGLLSQKPSGLGE